MDSTVTLAYALASGEEVVPISFRYGQRHLRELEAAKQVVSYYRLKQHVVVDMDLSAYRTNALTSTEVDVPLGRDIQDIGSEIPPTYVPARNIIFLSVAAGLCESVEADHIYIGAHTVDFSGYPDCRPEFFQAFEKVLEVGTRRGVEGNSVRVITPLLHKGKADIVRLGKELEAPLNLTWSCYGGGVKACGQCDSCLLRLRGFKEAGYPDEIEYEVSR